MEEVPYKLYPLFVKQKTWERIYEFIANNDKISASLKLAWIDALDFMKKELGRGFFNTADMYHPIDNLLGSASDAEVNYFIRWVNMLKTIKEGENGYDVLKEKLMSKNQSRPEGMPFMDIALDFGSNGFKTKFLAEENRNHIKTPDIEVTYLESGERCFIEVSQIRDSDERTVRTKQYHKILNVILHSGYDLPVAGELKRFMEEDAYQKTILDIRELKDRCWQTQSMVSLENENLSIAFSTNESFPDLEQWCANTKHTKGFNGLPVNFRDLPRIVDRGRIALKAQQIPVTESGVLYFPVQAMFFMVTDVLELIDAIVPVLAKEKHLFGVVFYAETIMSLKKDVYVNCRDFIYSVATGSRHHVRETVFIENIAYTGNLSSEARWAIRKAIA